MLRKILVPLDGSSTSEAALAYAATVAKAVAATITLVRVTADRSTPAQAIEASEDYLRKVMRDLQARGVAAETAVPYGKAVSDWIAEEVELRDINLIVMGSHGRAGVDHLLHGSIAEATIPRVRVPVLVIKAGAPSQAARLEQPGPCLLVALDGSTFAEAALVPARELAQALGARIVLVQVVPGPQPPSIDPGSGLVYVDDQDPGPSRAEAEAYLLGIQRGLRAEGFEAHADVRMGEAAEEIRHAAETHAAAAIVMATHGRTGLARVLIGSVAGRVLRDGSTPLVLLRPAAVGVASQPTLGVPA